MLLDYEDLSNDRQKRRHRDFLPHLKIGISTTIKFLIRSNEISSSEICM